MKNRPLFFAMLAAAIGITASASRTAVGGGQVGGLVRLQPGTPGTPQLGNANVAGTVTMGKFHAGSGLPDGLFAGTIRSEAGLFIESSNGNSVVAFTTSNTSYPALVGFVTAGSATNAGVWGRNDLSGSQGFLGYGLRGVYGIVGPNASLNYGIEGINSNTISQSAAVRGAQSSTGISVFGVLGEVTSASPGGSATAVRARNNGTGSLGIGVWASHPAAGWGVYTTAGPSGYAVLASAPTSGWAGYFAGNVNVSGTLSKSAGAFRIDHPDDPANRYLWHSFVESPDMKNIYDGNVTTDDNGDAVVTLPAYFESLNRDYRYQLTVLGQFAQAIVSKEIDGNQFTIRTDKPNVKVSWQVTGIRRDAYANANRIPNEVDKPAHERGLYLHPEVYGLPPSKGIVQSRMIEQGVTPIDNRIPDKR